MATSPRPRARRQSSAWRFSNGKTARWERARSSPRLAPAPGDAGGRGARAAAPGQLRRFRRRERVQTPVRRLPGDLEHLGRSENAAGAGGEDEARSSRARGEGAARRPRAAPVAAPRPAGRTVPAGRSPVKSSGRARRHAETRSAGQRGGGLAALTSAPARTTRFVESQSVGGASPCLRLVDLFRLARASWISANRSPGNRESIGCIRGARRQPEGLLGAGVLVRRLARQVEHQADPPSAAGRGADPGGGRAGSSARRAGSPSFCRRGRSAR